MSSRQSRSSKSFRRNKRITNDTTCIDIDLDAPIICSRCCEKKQRLLNARVMKNSLDDSRSWNQCRQPWVLRGDSQNDYRIYNKAWRVLEDDLGYPPPKLHRDDTNGGSSSSRTPTIRKTSIVSRNREIPAMPPSDSDNVDDDICVPEGYHSHHSCLPKTMLSSSGASPNKIPPPPVGTIAITTDSDLSNLSDLSPESMRVEKMIRLMQQKTIMLEKQMQQKTIMFEDMVLALSSQLRRALDVATTHHDTSRMSQNKAPDSSLTEAEDEDEDATHEEAWVNAILVQETIMAQEMADDDRGFRAALLEQEITDATNEEAWVNAILVQETIMAQEMGDDEEVVSTTHTLVHNAHLQRYKNGLTNFNKLMNQAMGGKSYTGTPLGKRLYGAAAALNPQSSLKNLEVTASLVHAALLADAGINTEYNQIAKNVPSATTLKELVVDAATDSTFSAAEEL